MKGQETYPVWSPGFSRRDVGNFDDCEMFKLAENVTSAPAKAGTPSP